MRAGYSFIDCASFGKVTDNQSICRQPISWLGRTTQTIVAIAIASAVVGGTSEAFAQSASNTTPVANQTTVTVNQASTQSVISTVSTSVQASLAQATMAGIRSNPSNAIQPSGINSGDAAGRAASAWTTGDYVRLRVAPDGNEEQRRLTNIYSMVAGGDVKVFDKVAVGLAGAYTYAGTDGRNVNLTRLDQRMRTYTVTPYIGWSVTDRLLIDGLVGYSYSDIANKDFKTRSLVSSNTSAHTMFAAINAAYFIPLDADFTLKPFAGISGQMARTAAYTDSGGTRVIGDHSNLMMGKVGSQLSYNVNEAVMTYVSAAWERTSAQKGIGENSARLSGGLESALTKDLALVVEATANVGRESQSDVGGSANLRLAF
ncbi:putative flagellin structural protein (Part 2) [Magnetospirillum sp. XM-1]|uniref:autotransporter outer membrane beta-barrel domain-containing protein n=1 Tax=Magnetospirillum sp. XM-1 TaxID=1663591 RepID=UPI00073DBC3C|nr:autotransporter outer membrane beta-barrel domain-containing protein [Magnetospirillum sp. XM-1]CUW39619.1 putative flagellin structural protein (Part 2) [Magnetospirillum sp. XM-1]